MLLCRVVEKSFNVNSSEITAECLKMFGVSDLAEVVATRKDRFIKKYMWTPSRHWDVSYGLVKNRPLQTIRASYVRTLLARESF